MTTIALKRGQTGNIGFSVLNAAGTGQQDLDGYTITLAIAGRGKRYQITGTADSPSTDGTGYFPVTSALYAALPDSTYAFEIWLNDGDTINAPVRSGTLTIADVPQAI